MRLFVMLTALMLGSACASQRSPDQRVGTSAPADMPVSVYSGPAPFAYRLGPELYAPQSADKAAATAYLATKGARLGCDAVVMARQPSHDEREGGVREGAWGICAFKVD